MEQANRMAGQPALRAGEAQGACRGSGASPARGAAERGRAADPQAPAKAKRGQFSVEYKQRILREPAAASAPGEMGALLRRAGLYSSHLITSHRQRERGELAGLSGKRLGDEPGEDVTRWTLSKVKVAGL